jgi:tRNA-dihydrouridine synthase 1
MIHAKVFLTSKQESRGGDSQFNLTMKEEGNYDTLAGIEGGDRPLIVQVSYMDQVEVIADGSSAGMTLMFC